MKDYTREDIIEKLKVRYPHLTFTPTTVTKNGDVEMDGIIVKNEAPIAPTIYTDSIIEKSSCLDEAVDIISGIIDQNSAPEIDINKLQDRDFILDRIRIGVQKSSDEDLVKKPVPYFPGMDEYLYFSEHTGSHDSWSVRIKSGLLETAGIDEEEAWSIAEKHTFEAATINSMAEILAGMTGMDSSEFDVPDVGMYVISNEEKMKGAASILDRDLLSRFAKDHDCSSIVVIPSSIHECILVPVHDTVNIEEFDTMVKEVNATQVSPEDVLVDRAYLITFSE